MMARCRGLYGTHLYLPCSAFSRSWRRHSNRLRGKQSRRLQETKLPTISWRSCVRTVAPCVWEHRKANGNVRISELAILAALAAGCRDASSIFEIGTFDGRTTLNLALNAPPACQIFTLDLPPEQATRFHLAQGERHMVEKPVPGTRYHRYRQSHPQLISRIHQILGDSASFDYTPYAATCSLVFVDGSHAYDYAISDTRAALTLIESGGIIVWHDYGIWEGVTRALEELQQRENLDIRHIRGTSLAILQ